MSIKGKAILKRGVKGGSGSGNYGHSGRPGKLGGSIPKGVGGAGGAGVEKPNQAQAISGGTLGNIPLGVPTSNASKVSQQLLQQHIERKSGFHIKDDEAVKTSNNQMVRTTIRPYEYDSSKLEVTHEVKQGKEWVPSFTQPYLAKTEYDAFYTGMIDHNRLVRASNKTT